jgi:predicted MPP superfamily phosphohydrolase
MLATTVGAVAGAAVYGGVYERHRISVTMTRLPVRGLPAVWEGVRIALLTDIHHSALVPAADVARAVALANAQRPDMVVLGGDYVSFADRAFMDPVAELLSALSAPLGVFAILGNHDDDRVMPAALERRQMTVLRDQRTSIVRAGERLDLVGIRFSTRETAVLAELVHGAQAPVLLLAHDPRKLSPASRLGVPAVLSGHTHGGQIVLPGVGPFAARKFPIVAGRGSMGHSEIFVSRGIGTVYVPVRINCPPEVAIVTLTPRADSPAPAG